MAARPSRPPKRSLNIADELCKRVYNRAAQIRIAFVVQDEGSTSRLATILRSGRGSDVRLKLLLSIMWAASNPPYDVSYPARTWATLLGLRDAEGNGARQIRSAFDWLAANRFVDLSSNPGMPTRVRLLNELDGTSYEVPGAVIARAREAKVDWDIPRERYFRVPPEFWTRGWVTLLSGAALAMLLVLLEAEREPGEELWFAPRYAQRRYGLSDSTRSDGLRELAQYGLVDTKRRSINPDTFDYRRMRNSYVLQRTRLDSAPQRTAREPAKDDEAEQEQVQPVRRKVKRVPAKARSVSTLAPRGVQPTPRRVVRPTVKG